MKPTSDTLKKSHATGEKILLGLLPYWTPLIPPLGISCLKSFLQQNGYLIKTIDLNTELKFQKIYQEYFNRLKEYVPDYNKGNFLNIGNDVLQNHLMAYLDNKDQKAYIKVVKIIIQKNYYYDPDFSQVGVLNQIIREFYEILETCLLDLLEKEKPAVLGLSVYRGTLPASLFAFKLTKEKYPAVKTVAGGGIFSQEFHINSENLKLLLKKAPFIDKFIIGEGEILFLKLLQGALPGSKKIYSLSDIHEDYLDLNSVTIPDFLDFDINHYMYLGAYASRSCPFQCNFCAETTYWGKYRKKSPGQMVKQLKTLFEKHNRQLFLMCDSLLNPVIMDLANELLKSGISLYWDGYLRVDQQTGSQENTLLWRRSGFYRARLGIESGSPHVLQLMGKKITVNQVKQAISSLASAGIKTTTYWVIGYPGETEADFQKTLNLIEELRDHIYEAECNHFRYFLTGQVNSSAWEKKFKSLPLYPKNAENMLLFQSWVLNCPPTREETFKRVNRFNDHCNRLGIPNPYSLEEINKADQRWKKLHKNSVPSLIEFYQPGAYIHEKNDVKKLLTGQNKFIEDNDFSF